MRVRVTCPSLFYHQLCVISLCKCRIIHGHLNLFNDEAHVFNWSSCPSGMPYPDLSSSYINIYGLIKRKAEIVKGEKY
jgi:hypothetical protein